jgi:hypothetical protein
MSFIAGYILYRIKTSVRSKRKWVWNFDIQLGLHCLIGLFRMRRCGSMSTRGKTSSSACLNEDEKCLLFRNVHRSAHMSETVKGELHHLIAI